MSERVARWLSSLSAKYIAVFALLVAVPVICTSVYLLYSSYQDNKRALIRLQQEKAKSVAVTIDQYFIDLTKRMKAMSGRYLSFTALGSVLQPLLEDNATDAFYVDSAGRKTLASAGGGLTRVKGNFLHDRSVEQARAAGVYFGPVYAPRLLSNPGARSMEVMVARNCRSGMHSRNSRNRSRRRDTRSQSHSGPRQADAARDVRIRLRGRRQGRAHRAPEQRRFHASFPGSSSGDQGAGFVADRIDGRPQLPRARRC